MPTISDPLLPKPQKNVFDLTQVSCAPERPLLRKCSIPFRSQQSKIARVRRSSKNNTTDDLCSRFATPGGAVRVPPQAKFPICTNPRLQRNMSMLTFLKNEEVQAMLKKISVSMQSVTDRRDRQLEKQRQCSERLMARVRAEEQRAAMRMQSDELPPKAQLESCNNTNNNTNHTTQQVGNTLDVCSNAAKNTILQPLPPKAGPETESHPFIRGRKPPGGYFHIDAIVSRVSAQHVDITQPLSPSAVSRMVVKTDFIKMNSDIRTPSELQQERQAKRETNARRAQLTEQKRKDERRITRAKHANCIKRWNERQEAISNEVEETRRACSWRAIIMLLKFGRVASGWKKKNITLTLVSIIMLKVVCSRRLCKLRAARLKFLTRSLFSSLQWGIMISIWRKRRAVAKMAHFLRGVKLTLGPVHCLHMYRIKLRRCARYMANHIRMRNSQLQMLRLKWDKVASSLAGSSPSQAVGDHVRDNVLRSYLKERSLFLRSLEDEHIDQDSRMPKVALIPSDIKMHRMALEAKQQQDIARSLLQ